MHYGGICTYSIWADTSGWLLKLFWESCPEKQTHTECMMCHLEKNIGKWTERGDKIHCSDKKLISAVYGPEGLSSSANPASGVFQILRLRSQVKHGNAGLKARNSSSPALTSKLGLNQLILDQVTSEFFFQHFRKRIPSTPSLSRCWTESA